MPSFIHCADLHLGRTQYGLEERFEDFGRAFAGIVDYALQNGVDFVLICGDLFDRRNINARTLIQATAQLKRLKNAGIPVIAVEGNHDKALRRDKISWMRYLAEEGLIKLLKPDFEGGRLALKKWDEGFKEGAVLEIEGVRIYGLGYLGSVAGRRLRELAEMIEPDDAFAVLMLHAGIGRMMGIELGSVKKEELEPLRGKIDYVALGHLHGRAEVDGWIFNPGAPECVDVEESRYDKGFYHVEVEGKSFSARFIPSQRREVYLGEVDLTGATDPVSAAERAIEEVDWEALRSMTRPIVRLVLKGEVGFDAMTIDLEAIRAEINARADPLVVEVVNLVNLAPRSVRPAAGSRREEIEREVLREMISSSPYGRWTEELIEAVLSLKSMALSGSEPEEIVSFIKRVASEMNSSP